MVTEWFSTDCAAQLRVAGYPASARGWDKIAQDEGWRGSGKARRDAGRWQYHISLFPRAIQIALAAQAGGADADWARYQRLPEHARAEAARRVECVRQVDDARRGRGQSEGAAIAYVADHAGLSTSTLRRWCARVAGLPADDWLAALAPRHQGRPGFATCHPDAWAALKSDFLRAEGPGFSACYRRMADAAAAQGWAPIPSEAALRRRLAAEVPHAVQVARRKGKESAERLHPSQRRDKSGMHALQAITMDGHTFDVMVTRPDGKGDPFRPVLVAASDIYSGMLLAWRVQESESRIGVRLVIGDVVERFGIPSEAILDNGRGFASKWITGGTRNRFRFKVKDDDPDGLLKLLGVKVHWATPYHGQSKPIERAFRDLCEDISKHPICAGAYTGNSPVTKPHNYGARVLDWAEFVAFVDKQIAAHNRRTGRRSPVAGGGSLKAAFDASFKAPTTVIRRATPAQRDFWLLAAEAITARRPSGEVHLLGARYWAPEMMQHIGRKIVARFDPDDLTRPARIYTLDGRLICTAQAIEDVPFLSAEDAQRHARGMRKFRRTLRDLEDQHVALAPDELARIYAPAARAPEPPATPGVTRIATRGGAARKLKPRTEAWSDENEADFARAAEAASAQLLKFPRP